MKLAISTPLCWRPLCHFSGAAPPAPYLHAIDSVAHRGRAKVISYATYWCSLRWEEARYLHRGTLSLPPVSQLRCDAVLLHSLRASLAERGQGIVALCACKFVRGDRADDGHLGAANLSRDHPSIATALARCQRVGRDTDSLLPSFGRQEV